MEAALMPTGRSIRSNLAMLLAGRASVKEVSKIVDKLNIEPSENLDTIPLDSVNIAAVQLQCKTYQNLGEYIVDMNLYISDAVNRRAHIVCLPAFAGMLPELQIRGGDIPDPERIREALGYYSDVMFDAYFNTMSALAASHRVYIMAGSCVYMEDDQMRHRAFLFDGSGELVGSQDKIAPTRLERALRIAGGTEVLSFKTPLGCVSMLIGSDIHHFETARAAKAQGAQIILNPTVMPGSYTPIDTAGGLNLRVQENSIYGVQCTMVGNTGLGVQLEAPCVIFAPNELIRARVKNGLMLQSLGGSEPDVLSATLDLDVIRNIKNPYLHDQNPDVLDRYIDRMY
jgi:predicted amidohydrolase